ncbi:RHS repeat domain-containing protein, partial [Gilliamella sp. Nev5-1]|uniref:RHS repeat domain-containing protein n=1 Tax=Gilliamella sp. Nev5-1 TaxID=3120251 RepID=UPI001179EA3F
FQFSYDALLRLTVVSDGQQGKTYYTYDDLGQITKSTYPNNTTREYQYNAYGKVTWFKDEAGKVTEYDYASPLHLMTEKRLPDGERLKFRYDNIHLQISEIENQKGERYRFSYTPTGQLSEEIGFD